jgi:hypothetical protein
MLPGFVYNVGKCNSIASLKCRCRCFVDVLVLIKWKFIRHSPPAQVNDYC